MKIYTGRGERGKTSLFSGERVPKDDGRVEAVGAVDALNASMGALAAHLPGREGPRREEIETIQGVLMRICAWVATAPDSPLTVHLTRIGRADVKALEDAIDAMDRRLPPLRRFVLPGGHPSSAWAHLARAECRRAERRLVSMVGDPRTLPEDSPYGHILAYVNRLSDYLFVLARTCNQAGGVADAIWEG